MSPELFKEICLKLRNAAPEQWEMFVQMFTVYTGEVIEAVTDADASNIMTAKGRAQQCKALLRSFIECDKPPLQGPV